MSALRNNSNTYNLIGFCFFLVLFYASLFFSLDIKVFSDDATFLAAATSGMSPLDYLSERYHTWTGRIAIEGIMFITIAIPTLWKLAIPTCLLLCAYATWKSFFADKLHYCYGIPLCLFFLLLINHSILDTTAFYVTGFYNYLLPVSAGLFSCAVFARPSAFSTIEKNLVIPLAFIASQSEQVGFSMLGFFLVTLLWDRNTTFAYRVCLLLVALTGFATLVSAPGNYLRLASEMRYMPEFGDYSFVRKVLTGFDVFNAHYTDASNLYPKIIALLLALLTLNKQFEFKRTAFLLAIAGVFQGSLFSYLLSTANNDSFSIRYLSSGLGLDYFASYTLTILSLVSATYIIRRIFSSNASFCLAVFLLLLHTASTTLVGLSPTAYESGFRVLLAGDVIGLMLICLLLKEAMHQHALIEPHKL